MSKKKTFSLFLLLFSVFLIYYIIFFSSSHYGITIPIRKNLFIVKAKKQTVFSINRIYSLRSFTRSSSVGICASPGCGPGDIREKENITLTLSDEQITSLLNQYKPVFVLLTDMKIKISDRTIFASATSLYPFLSGKLSGSTRLELNHFYVNDAYIGIIKAPKKITNFIEANGNKLIHDIFVQNDIWLNKMELVDGKLYFSAYVPKGMITVNQDGTILINFQVTVTSQNSSIDDSNIRF